MAGPPGWRDGVPDRSEKHELPGPAGSRPGETHDWSPAWSAGRGRFLLLAPGPAGQQADLEVRRVELLAGELDAGSRREASAEAEVERVVQAPVDATLGVQRGG